MAIRYMDPVDGDDANDGSSFALRFQSFTNGATSARVTSGDTVRIIASPAPNSIGSTTFTDNSATFTLGAAVNQTIEHADTAWTASANVTCTAPTGDGHKVSTACAAAAVASGFTTGKIAYKALGSTLDLSAYEQVSLWFKASASLAAGVVELRLCSDATGDTGVNTVPLPVGTTSATGTDWQVVVKDFATSLGASINSIALYANSDPGVVTLRLSNIVACKANGATDCLTHLSLVGKNTGGEPEWYPLLSIDGTTLKLGTDQASTASSTGRVYRGTTESATAYAIQPLANIDATNSSNNTIGVSGVTYSGGWNRTDMSTQTGETWLSGSYNKDSGLGTVVQIFDVTDATVSDIGLAHGAVQGFYAFGHRLDVNFLGIVGCATPMSIDESNADVAFDVGNVMHNRAYFGMSTPLQGANVHFTARRIEGSNNYGAHFSGHALSPILCDFSKIDNGASYGLATTDGNVIVRGPTFANNASGSIAPTSSNSALLIVKDGVFPSEPTATSKLQIRLHNYDATADDHRVIAPGWKVVTDATTRHTASGVAWKASITTATVLRGAKLFPLATVAVSASALVTCKAWVRRTNTALGIGIKVLGGQIAGVASDVSVECTAAADTWQEITMTFTPTAAGVVELVGYVYSSGTTHSGWWDDLDITQA